MFPKIVCPCSPSLAMLVTRRQYDEVGGHHVVLNKPHDVANLNRLGLYLLQMTMATQNRHQAPVRSPVRGERVGIECSAVHRMGTTLRSPVASMPKQILVALLDHRGHLVQSSTSVITVEISSREFSNISTFSLIILNLPKMLMIFY